MKSSSDSLLYFEIPSPTPNQIDLKWFAVWSDATVSYSRDSLSLFTIQMLRNLVRGLYSRVVPFQKKSFIISSILNIFKFLNRPWRRHFIFGLRNLTTAEIGTRDGHGCCKLTNCDRIRKSTSWQIYTVDLTLLSSHFLYRSLHSELAYLGTCTRGEMTVDDPISNLGI